MELVSYQHSELENLLQNVKEREMSVSDFESSLCLQAHIGTLREKENLTRNETTNKDTRWGKSQRKNQLFQDKVLIVA